MKKCFFVPLDGLGMNEAAMLELCNRLNMHDDRKWVFEHVRRGGQMLNSNMGNPYIGQLANPMQTETYN